MKYSRDKSIKLAYLVVIRVLHEVGTRSNVGRVLTLGDELQGEGVTRCSNTIGSTIIGSLDGAVLGASGVVWARCSVPLITVETVGVSADRVKPAPVGIDNNLTVDIGAGASTCASASLPCHLRVCLGLLLSDDPS